MKIKLSAVVLIIFSLAACTNSVNVDQQTDSDVLKQDTETARNLLLGQWCGERFDDDGNHFRWLVNRFEDGFYKIKFIETRGLGQQAVWDEYGLWGVRLPIYFTAARARKKSNGKIVEFDTTQASLYDAYEIESLSDDKFVYKSFKSGTSYTLYRQCVISQTDS